MPVMVALEAIDGHSGVIPEVDSQLPQLSPMTLDNTLRPTAGEEIRAKLKGLMDHPRVAAFWCVLNYAPVSGLATDVIYKMLGFPPEALLYYRANAVYKIFGPCGLKALKQHFAPDISIEELKLRRQRSAGPQQPPSQRLREAFSAESPFLATDVVDSQTIANLTSQLEPVQSGENIIPAALTHGRRRENNLALAGRIWALDYLRRTFLDPTIREKMTRSEYDRTTALHLMANEFETVCGRRICPHNSWQEMVYKIDIVKASLAREEAPEALEAMVEFFSKATTGLAGFIKSEMREHLYPDNLTRKILRGLEREMVDTAWGLLSVAQRGSLKEVREAALKETTNAVTTLKSIYALFREQATDPYQFKQSSFTASLRRAIEIIELADRDDIPSFTPNWLQKHFGAGQYQRIFTPIITENGEVTLRLHRDLNLLQGGTDKVALTDYPLLVVLALRYPFHDAITVRDGRGIRTVIKTQAVREQLFQGYPNSDEVVKSLISLEGEFSTREILPTVVPKPRSIQVFP